MTTLSTYVADNGALDALSWSEGLTSAAEEFVTAWKADTDIDSTTLDNGSTTVSRAGTYGTVSGSITETIYFFNTYTIDAMDFMRFIITNDGSNAMADAFFGVDSDYLGEYNMVGMAYGSPNDCSADTSGPTLCDFVFDIVATAGYTNSSGTATCDTTVSYGGDLCDPEAEGQAVFEAINSMRQ